MDTHQVELYVLNLSTESIPIWHSSIFVYGTEYAYGQEGIIMKCELENAEKVYSIGITSVPKEKLTAFVDELSKEFTVKKYNPMLKSCNTFSMKLCEYLCGNLDNFPDYIKTQTTVAEVGFGVVAGAAALSVLFSSSLLSRQ
jgi:PPPDE putative peptidase domain